MPGERSTSSWPLRGRERRRSWPGAVGTGANGDLVRSALAAEGVAVSSPPVVDLDTGICFVMVEPSAERTFVTTQGAERRISVESLQTAVAGRLVTWSA